MTWANYRRKLYGTLAGAETLGWGVTACNVLGIVSSTGIRHNVSIDKQLATQGRASRKASSAARRAYRVGYTYDDPDGTRHAFSITVLAESAADAVARIERQLQELNTPRFSMLGGELLT